MITANKVLEAICSEYDNKIELAYNLFTQCSSKIQFALLERWEIKSVIVGKEEITETLETLDLIYDLLDSEIKLLEELVKLNDKNIIVNKA